MKKKILILAGGFSSEREISLRTARAVNREIKKKYITKICEPDGNLVKNLRKYKPNIVFNALHGRYGEDGYVQAVLESEKIKYTHSGVLSSSLAIDKELSKKIFIKNKILTPKYIKFVFKKKIQKKKIIQKIIKKLNFPVVVKPINEGSSVNVYICNKSNIVKNLSKLESYGEALIEKSVPPGIHFGEVYISEKHRNFFVNRGNAKYEDMKKLINYVKDKVMSKTGINLELEIILVE